MPTARERAVSAAAAGEYRTAAQLLGTLIAGKPTTATVSFAVKQFEALTPHLGLAPARVALLRSFTIEPVVPFLRARCFAAGIAPAVHVGDFNAYVQELLDPNSRLYAFEPTVAFVAVRTADLVPELWHLYAAQEPGAVDAAVQRTISLLRNCIESFRQRSQAYLVIHNFELPEAAAAGVLGDQQVSGQREAIERINHGLKTVAAAHRGVHVLDYDALVARHGRLRWHDPAKWATMRLPIAADCLIHLADEYMRFLHPIAGRVCKALVLDLDNTLWGGIIGEDGIGGIKIGADYPGVAYLDFQRAVLDLTRRGIMLAICSRNNPDEAIEVLRTHPEMLLRPEHFAAIRIGWEDKDQAIAAIATQLNIGLDALAFFDDNPRERDLVRTRLPEVHVIDVPDDPIQYAAALGACARFERLTVSDEDRARHQLGADERARQNLQQQVGSVEDFYRSLQMTAAVGRANAVTTGRIAQLTQKTNQFNLTTRRYSEAEVAALATDPSARVLWLRLRDRFGDTGLVGVAILRFSEGAADLDTLLLSCRVIGRTVETALLAAAAREAIAGGATRLTGWFVPTAKNAPARDFYSRHAFTCIEQDGDSDRWEIDLAGGAPASPPWMALEIDSQDSLT